MAYKIQGERIAFRKAVDECEQYELWGRELLNENLYDWLHEEDGRGVLYAALIAGVRRLIDVRLNNVRSWRGSPNGTICAIS